MINLNLIKTQDRFFRAEISIENRTDTDFLDNWKLCFNFAREFKIASSENKIIYKTHVGDYHELIFASSLNKSKSISFIIEGNYPVKKYSDAIDGCFVVLKGKENCNNKIIEMELNIDLSSIKNPIENPYLKYKTQINNCNPNINSSNEIIIPKPVFYSEYDGKLVISNTINILNNSNIEELHDEISFLCNVFSSLLPKNTNFTKNTKTDCTNLLFEKSNPTELKNKATESEYYSLIVNEDKIIIKANNIKGFKYGFISFLQIISCREEIQSCEIKDYPRFEYRGTLLDTARHFRTVIEIKQFLKLLALYKVNHFHWHLTEDEAWRVEIKKYPNLTKIGSVRGYNLPIPPSLGSGPTPSGGFYTQDEIREIVTYASKLNITIIPELDIPGHARALIKSFETANGNPLIDSEDKSVYSSAQNFSDNLLNPALEYTYEVLENILKELSELFPSKILHLGCDEVPAGAWLKSPKCIDLMKKHKLNCKKEIQNYFIKRIIAIVNKYGKKAAGWEEITEGGNIKKETTIYSWKGIKAGINAASEGYDVVMAPAQHVYFDLSYNNDIDEPGAYWTGGNVDTYQAYIYEPCSNFPKNIANNIRGIQGCQWSEQIKTQDILEYFSLPKIAAFAETAWTAKNNKNWNDFINRFGFNNCNILDKMNLTYRVSPPGIRVINNRIYANTEFPGLIIKYTLDNSEPSIKSNEYTKPITLTNKIKIIKMTAYNYNNKTSKTITLNI